MKVKQKYTIIVTLDENQDIHDDIRQVAIKHNLSDIQTDMLHAAIFEGAILTEIKAGRAEIHPE